MGWRWTGGPRSGDPNHIDSIIHLPAPSEWAYSTIGQFDDNPIDAAVLFPARQAQERLHSSEASDLIGQLRNPIPAGTIYNFEAKSIPTVGAVDANRNG